MNEPSSTSFGTAQGKYAAGEIRDLVTGQGRYTDDYSLSGQVYAVLARSPFAHGRIRSLDTAAARAMPGVLAIYTGADVEAAGLGQLRCLVPFDNADGTPMAQTRRPLLAHQRVRFVGEAVALVVAETQAQAEDAADAVTLDVDIEPTVTDVVAALQPDSPRVWPEITANTALHWQTGDAEAVIQALRDAHHVTRVRLVNTRVVGNPMEPRSALGWYDQDSDHYTLVTPSQGVNLLRQGLTQLLGLAAGQVRVITPQVGGGFGVRTPVYPEQALVLWAARRLGRPVKWSGSRGESFLADNHGRDSVVEGALALDSTGRFLALQVKVDANMGAYLSSNGPVVPTRIFAGGLASLYRTPAIALDVRCVLTHTAPTGPYRGAGRPEAAYLIERLVDEAARELKLDRIELRRRNLIPAGAMPYRTPLGQTYDTGEFEAVLDQALKRSDWNGFATREAAARERGCWRGRGLACFLETAGAVLKESATIHFTDDGRVQLRTAVQSNGQGHSGSLARVVAEALELPLEQVRVVQGDSELTPEGFVSVASRSLMMAGSAAAQTCQSVVEKGRRLASHLLEAAEADLEYAGGVYRVAGTDRQISLLELARRIPQQRDLPDDLPRSMDTTEAFTAPEETFPNGCHICEVELDPETGVVQIVAYTAVDDCGRAVVPAVVHGQLHGGIVQGLGQVLGEQCRYDDDGQLLSASFLDYPMPRADAAPNFSLSLHPVPSRTNPLGVKGVGEAGTVGAIPAAMNAIVDALGRAGISRFDMPATPQRIWQAVRDTSQ